MSDTKLLRADILASWSRVSSFQEQGALLNRCYVALGEQQSAPAGYVMVPVEPTPKMVDATWYHDIDMNGGIESQGARNKRIYEAMLAAAPKAEQPPVQDITYWSIQVEKRLCEKLGKPWQASGMSIETLIDELAAAPQPVAQDGWIPISERLPDPGYCWVLVYADGAMNCMAWHDGAWHDWTNAQAHNIFPDEITHWMPLPSAPEDKP